MGRQNPITDNYSFLNIATQTKFFECYWHYILVTKRPVGYVRVHVGSANSRFKTELSTLECAIDGFTSRSPDVINMAVFGVNKAPKTIVVNGNHLEFCQYFSLFRKTRYLIHLTTCNKHIFQIRPKSLFVKVYYAQFLIIFPYFLIKLANKLLQMKHLHDKDNSFSSIFYLQYDILIIWEIQYGCS